MKKLLFALVALFATLSISAQVIEVYDNGGLTKVYTNSTSHKYKAIFKQKSKIARTFTVGENKKVRFAKGNLYWNGSAFYFEDKQTDYRESWDPKHVGLFFWTSITEHYQLTAPYNIDCKNLTRTISDKFWCDESNKITVNGEDGFYALSIAEWNYLTSTRDGAGNKWKAGVEVGGVTGCIIIAPDQFTGTLRTSYTLQDIDNAGFICLPPAGYRISNNTYIGSSIAESGISLYYWSSTPRSTAAAQAEPFTNIKFVNARYSRNNGYALRLVKDIEEGEEDDDEGDIGGGGDEPGGGDQPGGGDNQDDEPGDGVDSGIEYVTIGGKKWATKNLGATSVAGPLPQCSGDYYQWGSLNTLYSKINWKAPQSDPYYYSYSTTFTPKKGIDGVYDEYREYTGSALKLPDANDVVIQTIGNGWRMPTTADFANLRNACTGETGSGRSESVPELNTSNPTGGVYWLTPEQTYLPDYNGVYGTLFVDRADPSKRVFFPAAGFLLSQYGYNELFDVGMVDTNPGYMGDYMTSEHETGLYAGDWIRVMRISDNLVFPGTSLSPICAYPIRPVKD